MAARRITLVTDELRGLLPVGGIGTGTTFLALALARMGHDVEVLLFGKSHTTAIDDEWSRTYAAAGISVRFVPQADEIVEPRYFAWMRETQLALRDRPADVVIVQDTTAPAYIALRLRQLGLAFENTLFVVVCYGTRLWMKDVSRTVRVFPYLLGLSVLEGASLELADIVVSPSKYVIDWMTAQGCELPSKTVVIPYLSRSAAMGVQQARPTIADGRVERLAFFGRLEERKGLRQFAKGLNALEPELLETVELEFLGAPTRAWPPERVTALLSETAKRALRGITFETRLDQPEVLERLARPGTLAVMPSLGETFGNAVYECLERGIPFIASSAGATPELIASEDHPRVLFEPTPEGVAAALHRALSDSDALRPARPAFDAHTAYERWAEVVATTPPKPPSQNQPIVDVVVVRRGDKQPAELDAGAAPFVVWLDAEDEPTEDFIASLVRAQAVSGADVVTCGLRLTGPDRQHLFLGDPGALGLVSNSYGTAALIRRSLLADLTAPLDWPLLARLYLEGARIVSIPLPLVCSRRAPQSIDTHPTEALAVSALYDGALPDSLRSLARLAAGLAAEAQRAAAIPAMGTIRRAWNVARDDGVAAFASRVRRRLLKR